MVPKNTFTINNDFKVYEQPSYTFKLNYQNENFQGFVDELEAVKQAVYLILNIERYQYLIYDWNYGVEFSDLLGCEKNYAAAQIERRITDALLQDERIQAVENFEFEYGKNNITSYFLVKTNFGDFETQRQVEI